MKYSFNGLAFFSCLLIFQSGVLAQDIVGVWKTIDDRTNLPTSHIEIYEENGSYFGKVVEMLRDDPSTLCELCPGKKKNQPIMHMVILRNLKADGDAWSSGRILDPETGKEYKCNVSLKSEDTLFLRGYIGAPLFGRTQEWLRVE